MVREEPILFKFYPNLKKSVPWIPILTNSPTPIDRLDSLEDHLKMEPDGALYIKRDDIDHDLYGGNKLRKFEFIFADMIKKKKKGVMTFGGIGTNHGLACAIIAEKYGLKCDLFLALQPLTWHVQRSLILFKHYGAKMHYSKGYGTVALKSIFFKLSHLKHYIMLPGGSLLLGKGSPLGTIGFINAAFELKKQIDEGTIPEPEIIYVAGGSTGTSAGLIGGLKVLGLKTKVHVVAVSDSTFVNSESIVLNANKALEYLQGLDDTFPKIRITTQDFEIINGYLGSEYGIKTKRSQAAADLINELEGKKRGFKIETTYTGKAMAGMLDFLKQEENRYNKILFWNTYNSNDLDKILREIKFDHNQLPKKLHQFYKKKFQCWQIVDCPKEIRENCPAYLNHDYRFWKVAECKLDKINIEKAKEVLNNVIKLENA